MRVVFMGTPDFSVPSLKAIHEDSAFEVAGVFTQPDRGVGRGQQKKACPMKRAALELELPVFQPEKLTDLEDLKSLSPDVVVVAAYGQILKKAVLELPRFGCVNIHSSLLPRWRGAAPIQWAILSGDDISGVTTMQMDEGLDTGGILMTSETKLTNDETAESLHDRLAEMAAPLVVETLKGLESGALKAREQDDAQSTYAKKLSKDMQWLDARESAVILDRKIRALNPWPGTSLRVLGGKRLKLLRAHLTEGFGEEGTIFMRDSKLYLGARGGWLELEKLQWEGKKPVSAADFINGIQSESGVSLPLEIDV